ncbi:MAG: hypothetical protein HY924_06200 [Elusimicrobia bacterium]|nr:hypothetical protein [Elusimicrobiota bacterium]
MRPKFPEFTAFVVPPGEQFIHYDACVSARNPDAKLSLHVRAWVSGEEPPREPAEAERVVPDGESLSHPITLQNRSGRSLVFRWTLL